MTARELAARMENRLREAGSPDRAEHEKRYLKRSLTDVIVRFTP